MKTVLYSRRRCDGPVLVYEPMFPNSGPGWEKQRISFHDQCPYGTQFAVYEEVWMTITLVGGFTLDACPKCQEKLVRQGLFQHAKMPDSKIANIATDGP